MSGQTELVFLPSPGIGHIVPAVELAKLIVQTNSNISIDFILYFMTNESTKIQSYFQYLTELELTRITFIILPCLTNPPDFSSPCFVPTVIQLHKPLIKQAILDRQLKPAAIMVDLTSVRMAEVAEELNIPFYIFFTSGHCYLNTIFQFQALADEVLGYDGVLELASDPDTELELTGFHSRVPAKVLPGVFLDKESGLPRAMIHLGRRFREAKGILVNSFMELEPLAIKALQEVHDNAIPKVYPVGPILALQDEIYNNNGCSSVDDVMRWLDEQPPSSVVFVCAGSGACFQVGGQAKEMANGLDRSGHRFLWTLKMSEPSDEYETFMSSLPEGFMDRTALKGKIVSWAPQAKVLAHQAVAGFVSHCGWNSILESIWFGVPIATWPMQSDQQINAFTLVKELGLGIEIRLDYRWDYKNQMGNFLVTADEIENGVKLLMNVSSGDQMWLKLFEISHTSRQVLQPNGGSSNKWLVRFVEEVTQNVSLN